MKAVNINKGLGGNEIKLTGCKGKFPKKLFKITI